MESPIYFHKKNIANLKNELYNLDYSDIILIHKNEITFVSDYDQQNDDSVNPFNKFNKLNDNINNDEPYEDNIIFSYYSTDDNNIYNTGFRGSEAIYLSFTIDKNIINCHCSRTEVDPDSIMYSL